MRVGRGHGTIAFDVQPPRCLRCGLRRLPQSAKHVRMPTGRLRNRALTELVEVASLTSL